MLNYPSISFVFQQTSRQKGPLAVQHTMKNVGSVPWTYILAVYMPSEDVMIEGSLGKLVFTKENKEQRFNVTIVGNP